MTVSKGLTRTLGVAVESSLGTSTLSGAYEFRFTAPTFPEQSQMLAANPTSGHSHPYKNDDSKPIPYEKVREGALGFSTEIRRHTSDDTAPIIAVFMQSGGCGVNTSSKTVLDAYTGVGSWALATEGAIAGEAGLIELSNGLYFPTLVASNSGASDYNIVPLIDLPSASADTKAFEVMTTIWPQFRQVESDKTLGFRRCTPMDYTGGSNEVAFDYTGCALATGPTITIEPAGGIVTIPWSFHVGKIDAQDVAYSQESFVDSEKFVVIDDNFRVDIVNFSTAGGITVSPKCIYKIDIDTGFTTVPIVAGGCESAYAGMQGYMHVPGTPTITITADFSITDWLALESDQTPKEIAIVQPTDSLSKPAFGFWGHNAVLRGDDAITVDYETNAYVTMTLKYTLGSAELNSETDQDDIGAAPWHWAISGEGA